MDDEATLRQAQSERDDRRWTTGSQAMSAPIADPTGASHSAPDDRRPPVPPTVTVETGGVRLTLAASRVHPSGGAARVRAWGVEGDVLDVRVSAGATAFAEETTLRLRIDAPPTVRPRVRADDPALTAEIESGGGWAAGPVRVGGTAGWLRLDVWTGSAGEDGDRGDRDERRPGLRIAVEIVPSKLDYRRDLAALTADIERLSGDLAAALVAPAAPGGAALDALARGSLAPLAALDALSGDLAAAVRAALARPLGADRRIRIDAPAHRARHAGPAVVRALARHADAASVLGGSAFDARLRVPALALDPALDTPEHRYLAARLDAAARAARRVAIAYAGPGARVRAARGVLLRLAARLDALLALAPLAAVRGLAPPSAPPLRATLAPGYRDALAVLARVRQRLIVAAAVAGVADPPGVRLRPLHALYETWAFLATVRALGEATGAPLDLRRLVRRTGPARLPTLARARVDVRIAGGIRLRLLRAPTLTRGLTPQRPDLLLMRQRGDAPVVWHVLDAKYRLDRRPETVARLGLPAPPPDALGDLHRYRDALLGPGGARPVATAVALYPWRDDDGSSATPYADSRLAAHLAAHGVGAIPLLPGATGHLEAWVAAIVAGEV